LEQVAVQINRNVFFDTLSETTRLLQRATLHALESTRDNRDEITQKVNQFSKAYGGYKFSAYPISITGTNILGREKEQQHRKDASTLRRYLVQTPALSRLTLDALPRFVERTGLTSADDSEKLERFFAKKLQTSFWREFCSSGSWKTMGSLIRREMMALSGEGIFAMAVSQPFKACMIILGMDIPGF
jgi:hypothetical protein